MSTQQPRALALPSSPAFRALHSRGHRPLCLHHLEPHRQRCTFCIDADTEHTHHTHTGPTGPPTDTVPGSVPGLASEPPSTDTKKSLSKVLPDAPKERTFNTVGKAGRAPPEQAQRAAAGPTHLVQRPRVWAQASPSPASSPAAGTVWTMAPALTTSTETQDTRHNRKATDSKSQTGAEGLCGSTKFQW